MPFSAEPPAPAWQALQAGASCGADGWNDGDEVFCEAPRATDGCTAFSQRTSLRADRGEHLLNLGSRSRHLVAVGKDDSVALDGVRATEHTHALRHVAQLHVLRSRGERSDVL